MTLKRMQLSTTNRPLEVIHHWHREGMLVMDQPYQRGDVWGTTRRVNLIKSILMGIPIPSIIVNDRGAAEWSDDYTYAIIDGKQRATTILMFLTNELSIPGEWVGIAGDITFGEIPIARRRGIKQHAMGFCEGRLPTIEDEIEVFELVNYGGVPQGETDNK